MALLLRNGRGNKNAYKSLIVAEYCGVKIEDKKLQLGAFNETDIFLKTRVFQERKHFETVPVLETPDGPLVECHAIVRYTNLNGNNTLCGSSVFEFVQIEQWLAFAARLDPFLARWVYPRIYDSYNAHDEEVVIGCLKKALAVLNNHLATRTYIVGNDITLADIVMACDLHFGFTRIMMKPFTSEFPHVERYFWNLVGLANFKKILGEVKQTDSLLLPQQPIGSGIYLDRIILESAQKKQGIEHLEKVNWVIKAEKKVIGMLEAQKESMTQMIGGPHERAKRMIEGQKKVLQILEFQKDCMNQEIEAQNQKLNQMVGDAERLSVGS